MEKIKINLVGCLYAGVDHWVSPLVWVMFYDQLFPRCFYFMWRRAFFNPQNHVRIVTVKS